MPKGRNYQPNFGSLGQHPDHAVAYTSVGGHDTADFSSIVDDDHARESVKDRAQKYYENRTLQPPVIVSTQKR